MNILKIHPLVWIFKQALDNPQNLIDFYENNFEWEPWYTFGTMLEIRTANQVFETFPDYDLWNNKLFIKEWKTQPNEHMFTKKITDVVYETTKMFFEENKLESDDIGFSSFSIAKYKAGPEARMAFHTDYRQERYKIPEDNMYVTSVFYLNDNYEGGEISFIELDSNQEIIWHHKYKPEAGDVIVFSSKEPIYHAVSTVQTGEKYIVRTYWHQTHKPNQEWIDGVSTYGEQEWIKMKELEAKEMQRERLSVTIEGEFFSLQYVKKDTNE